MNKIVFLDRDGTINVDKNYIYKIEDFEYIKGSIEAMRMFQDYGYKLIIITNQSGIARGFFTEEEYDKLNAWMLMDMKQKGINILATYYCPHLKQGIVTKYSVECTCRKPGTGLFRKAIREYDIDLGSSYVIGDKMRDISICKETTAKGILLTGTNSYLTFMDKEGFLIKPNLFEAAKYITKGND